MKSWQSPGIKPRGPSLKCHALWPLDNHKPYMQCTGGIECFSFTTVARLFSLLGDKILAYKVHSTCALLYYVYSFVLRSSSSFLSLASNRLHSKALIQLSLLAYVELQAKERWLDRGLGERGHLAHTCMRAFCLQVNQQIRDAPWVVTPTLLSPTAGLRWYG